MAATTKLTDKQQKFVEEYLIDLNSTQAAIRAGYSEKTASRIGSENVSKPEIAQAIAEAQKKRSERTQIDADWLLTRLAQEADADVSDLYDENGHIKSVHDWPEIWRKGLVAGIETTREKVGEDDDGKPEYARVDKVKLSDRVKRLELIGRHIGVGAFRDGEITIPSEINLVINRPNGD